MTPTPEETKELYEQAEAENDQLRRIIRWCADRLPTTALPTLRAMFDGACVPDVTDDLEAEFARLHALALQLSAQIEPVVATRKVPRGWDDKTTALLEQARAFTTAHALLRPTGDGLRP